jgi:signal transduction histidine kinase
MMPHLDGLGLLARLRADPATSSVPVILMSARAGEERRVEGIDTGADDYLVKPFNARELLARVGAQIQLARVRRQANLSLRESEARLRAFVTSSSDVVYRMSPDWSEMRHLDGRYFIADTKEPRRGWIQEYIYPDDQLRVLEAIDEAIRTKSPFELEHRVRRVDGTLGWTSSHAIPLLDAEGAITEWFGTASDVTLRKEAAEALGRFAVELTDADRHKNEFLAMLAHELRNPLAPISAAAQLLKFGKVDEARVRQTSEIIGRQVQHLTSLVDDLLDVSRVSRGQIELEKVPLEMRHVVADAVEQVNSLMLQRGHQLVLHLAPVTAWVLGDAKRLVQVIANLLANAAKYTPEGGNIRLAMQVEQEQVVLTVQDDGIGLAADLIPHIFELFIQAERSSDRSAGGLGLGLALVKSLVALHGGKASCVSAGLGCGSVFTVTLPLLAADEVASNAATAPCHPVDVRRPLLIMIVDDNVDAALTMAMLLEYIGHRVIVEHGSRVALERARKEQPDVCLLDIGLPEINGNQLAQQLRAQSETAAATLIAVTGYGGARDRSDSLAAGFDEHMVKPLDFDRLEALLTAIVQR